MACILLSKRAATTSFRLVNQKDTPTNKAMKCVIDLTAGYSRDATLMESNDLVMENLLDWQYPTDAPVLQNKAKVTSPEAKKKTKLPVPSTRVAQMNQIGCPEDIDSTSGAHRGRKVDRRHMWWCYMEIASAADLSGAAFWKVLRRITDKLPRQPAVTLSALLQTFEQRMNPPSVLPAEFDAELFQYDKAFFDRMPAQTEDTTDSRLFTRPFSTEEVDVAKKQMASHTHSAKGIDGISCVDLMKIPSDKLTELFNLCIEKWTAPKIWLTTTLVAILKAGRPPKTAESYRLIALECFLLKMLTLLIAYRFREWLAGAAIIPESQNGFREGYRTTNCPFVIRCAMDKGCAEGTPIVVLFIDLENAFPSTNLPTLWKKIAEAGGGGPLIDWMRMLYDQMRYTVTQSGRNRQFTETFLSRWGILAGDSLSLDFFTFYVANCVPPNSPNDVVLDSKPITSLSLADDMSFLEKLAAGVMQEELDYMDLIWCARNFLRLNPTKTKAMVFGKLPKEYPTLKVRDTQIDFVNVFKYVGVDFQAGDKNNFASHYKRKAKEAEGNIYQMLWIKSVAGDLWPRETLRLYMASIDPHLIHGCEVVIDVNLKNLEVLEKVQIRCLRRILGLGERSILVVLFTETGIMPIRYRRIIIAPKYLKNILQMPPDRYAHIAYRDSCDLLSKGQSCWLGDICWVLKNLPVPVQPTWAEITSVSGVNDLIKRTEESCAQYLNESHKASKRLPLISNRLSNVARPTLAQVSQLRSYLVEVIVPAHQIALTKLLCGQHLLAVETLRWRERRRAAVPRDKRICRFCRVEVEDEPHVLLYCPEVPPTLMARQKILLDKIRATDTNWEWSLKNIDGYEFLQKLITYDSLLPALAVYVYHVLQEFRGTAEYLAENDSD